jgi:hypothetical protein
MRANAHLPKVYFVFICNMCTYILVYLSIQKMHFVLSSYNFEFQRFVLVCVLLLLCIIG